MVPRDSNVYCKQHTDDFSIFRVCCAAVQRFKVCCEGGVRKVIRSSKSNFKVICPSDYDLMFRDGHKGGARLKSDGCDIF